MKVYKHIFFINSKKLCAISVSRFFIFFLSFACFAQDEETTIQNIPVRQFPALVYTQEDLSLEETQRTSLMIATIIEGKADIQKIMAAQSINAAQLSNTVFLLQANQYPHDSSVWQQTQFLVDFKTGSKVLLCKSQSRDKLVHYYCLRSVPEKNEAVLLRYGQGTDKSTLIQVDLKTLETKTKFTFPEKEKLPEFNGPHVKISPDFKHLAAMIGPYLGNQISSQSRQPGNSLKVLDLDTMKITIIDDKVQVQLSPHSSIGYVRPPFDWISNDEILYQNMIPIKLGESQYVLKCANIKNNTTTEWLTKQLPLTIGGGNLSCDWFTGEVYFQGFLVDLKNKILLPKIDSCSIKQDSYRTEINFNGKLIFNYDDYLYVDSCISHSKNNFAFFVRFNGNEQNALYIKNKDINEPAIILQDSSNTDIIAWIENTGENN